MFTFPSDEWIVEFKNRNKLKREIQRGCSPVGRRCLFCVLANQSIGLNESFAIWTDLFHGEVQGRQASYSREAQKAKYVITGDYPRWKQVIKKSLTRLKA